jgi:hypothetical protein
VHSLTEAVGQQHDSDEWWEQADSSKLILECKIWGFHGGDYEDCHLLGVTPCSSCRNWRFAGTCRLHHQLEKDQLARNVSSN